jgi:hypothetical protein
MHTRTGWLSRRTKLEGPGAHDRRRRPAFVARAVSFALCLAGLALVPAAGRCQSFGDYEVPPADPVWPLPLGHDRLETGGFYAAGRFVYFRQTNALKSQVVARRGLVDFDGSITADLTGTVVLPGGGPPVIIPGTPRPGTFIGSGTPALFTDDVGKGSYQPGFGVTLGWRFGGEAGQEGLAIELDWWHLVQAKYAASASLVPPGLNPGPLLADSFLFAPVYNFPIDFAGPNQKLAIGNPQAAFGIWNGASLMQIEFVQRYTQVDINARVPIYQDECNRCYGLVGPRFAWIWERFKWRTVSADFTGRSDPDDVATYTNIVSNRMYGVQCGLGTERYLFSGFSISLDLRAATLVDVVKERARYQRDDRSVLSKRSATQYTFVPELQAGLNLWWYPIEGVQLRVGYDFMVFFNTISSKEPISFNYGGLDPHWDRTVRYFDGFNAGIGFIF